MIKKIIYILILQINLCSLFAENGIVPHINNVKSNVWNLYWHDEFNSKMTIDNNWITENSVSSNLLCSRWRDNLNVKHHRLYIINKKQNKGGKVWTSGSMKTKSTFKYGFFECRMKISKAPGVNNSFWLYCSNPSSSIGHFFEIDIIEGHYPNQDNSNIHDDGTKDNRYIKQNSKQYYVSPNLYDRFHIFGLEWDQQYLKFYIDGNLVRTEKNTCCFDPALMVLGTAVMNWAGKVTNSIDKTFMIVDYVRVFKRNGE